ncbi:MAG: Spx/MgsR family RNA polymerase-binding regulatory protein [Bacteroidia bacterium]|jgi:arsenate reductase
MPVKNAVTLYGIPNCDTMKKAFNWLNKKHIPFHFHNYKTEGISAEIIKHWLQYAELLQLINTKSTTFRNLTEQEKKSIQKPDRAIALMIKYPSMIKRPVTVYGSKLLVGFSEPVWENSLK